MSEQYSELRAWVDGQLQALALPRCEWTPLRGDAGTRRYFRLSSPQPSQVPLLAVYSPPSTENNAAFVAIANHFREGGIRAPAIVAQDLQRGYLLVEDLGGRLLLDELTRESVNTLYAEASMSLLRIQQCPPAENLFPAYDRNSLRREMELFPQWFVETLLGHPLTPDDRTLLDNLFGKLEDSALGQPQVVVHRDYHSRNLVYRSGGACGVIDFQDAVVGPMTYDLVSLLRDCYVQWPDEWVKRWALAYGTMAAEVGIFEPVTESCFLQWFDWMGLQRHIKVLGIFARLSLRDGKHGYLNDLPLVIHYTLDVAARYEEFQPFVEWFRTHLLPKVTEQVWFQPVGASQ